MQISILGGDERSIKLGKFLMEDGHKVSIFGFDPLKTEGMYLSDDLTKAIRESEFIIGSIPCTRDNIHLEAPLYSYKIKLEDIFNLITKDQIFIGGKITKTIEDLAAIKNIKTIDILEREEMTVLNAIPTAEGAIQIALECMDITLHGSKVMVLGFGRIGKVLANVLHGFGANVYVEARNHADLAWIKTYGYKPVNLNNIEEYLPTMDLIINTIPSMILDESRLRLLKHKVFLIDVASSPGGIDFDKAKELGIKTNWALALPGKVAPRTAAEVMKETIYNIIGEMEE